MLHVGLSVDRQSAQLVSHHPTGDRAAHPRQGYNRQSAQLVSHHPGYLCHASRDACPICRHACSTSRTYLASVLGIWESLMHAYAAGRAWPACLHSAGFSCREPQPFRQRAARWRVNMRGGDVSPGFRGVSGHRKKGGAAYVERHSRYGCISLYNAGRKGV